MSREYHILDPLLYNPHRERWIEVQEDRINHPKHYTQGIECINYILSHKMNYMEGNIIKYVTRYKDKGGVEDLKKAQWYLSRLIENCVPEVQELEQEHHDEIVRETADAVRDECRRCGNAAPDWIYDADWRKRCQSLNA